MTGAADMLDHLATAWRAIDSAGLAIALVLLASILAAVGGLVSWRMRVYGAMVGGMVVNAVVKAEGGGFGTALAAMLAVTAIAVALGSAGLILRVMRSARR